MALAWSTRRPSLSGGPTARWTCSWTSASGPTRSWSTYSGTTSRARSSAPSGSRARCASGPAGKKTRYVSVLDFARRRQDNRPGHAFYVSGHSLGGGIADLVGAELRLPTVSFSPPGVATTVQLLELDPKRLRALAMDVVPEKDLIPMITGDHGTMTLPLDCSTGRISCHRPVITVCEILYECGDSAKPRRKLPCDVCPDFFHSKLRKRSGYPHYYAEKCRV